MTVVTMSLVLLGLCVGGVEGASTLLVSGMCEDLDFLNGCMSRWGYSGNPQPPVPDHREPRVR